MDDTRDSTTLAGPVRLARHKYCGSLGDQSPCSPFGPYGLIGNNQVELGAAAIIVSYLNDGHKYLVTQMTHDNPTTRTWIVPDNFLAIRDWSQPASYDGFDSDMWSDENCGGVLLGDLPKDVVGMTPSDTRRRTCGAAANRPVHTVTQGESSYPNYQHGPGPLYFVFIKFGENIYTLEDSEPNFVGSRTVITKAKMTTGHILRVLLYAKSSYTDICLLANGSAAQFLHELTSISTGEPK